MKIKIGELTLSCDRCIEEDGRFTLYSGGEPVRSVANIPRDTEVISEDGEIEHVPSPLERARAELEEKTTRLQELGREYIEVLADDEAKRARLERIDGLIKGLGESLSLSKLIQFVKDLKVIIAEAGNGEDQL